MVVLRGAQRARNLLGVAYRRVLWVATKPLRGLLTVHVRPSPTRTADHEGILCFCEQPTGPYAGAVIVR